MYECNLAVMIEQVKFFVELVPSTSFRSTVEESMPHYQDLNQGLNPARCSFSIVMCAYEQIPQGGTSLLIRPTKLKVRRIGKKE